MFSNLKLRRGQDEPIAFARHRQGTSFASLSRRGGPTVLPQLNFHTNLRNANDSDSDDDPDDDDDDLLDDESNNNNNPTIDVNAMPTQEDDNSPPTPWGNSTAKQTIIHALKDPLCDIHLQIGVYTNDDWDQVNFKGIHSSYAPKYKLSNFRANLKRILHRKLVGTGPFKVEQETTEPWTSRTERSKAWHLLYGLRMSDETNDELNSMTAEEIWESNELFKQYPLQDFKKYNNDMIKSTTKQRKVIEQDEEDFKQHCTNKPHNEMTDRDEPFWYNHPAKALLKEDVESGLAYDLKPVALRETREEYQQFKLKTFRKHIYQEKERQRAAPYWRLKRNIAARQMIEKEREEMKRQWTIERMFGSIRL